MRSPLAPAGEASATPPAIKSAKSAPGEFTRLVQRDPGLDTSANLNRRSLASPRSPPANSPACSRRTNRYRTSIFSSAANPLRRRLLRMDSQPALFPALQFPLRLPLQRVPVNSPGSFHRQPCRRRLLLRPPLLPPCRRQKLRCRNAAPPTRRSSSSLPQSLLSPSSL